MTLKYYTDDSFLRRDGADVSYGFFTRLGGVSPAPYFGLNCGVGSDDVLENVKENKARMCQELNVQPALLHAPYQVHSNVVSVLDAPWDDVRPEADAVVTDKAGLAIGIVTADCAPVLFFGEKNGGASVIGAAHAGWKGAVFGVLDNVISEMIKLGATQESLRACVGPCIGRKSYEVTEGFTEPFLNHDEESEHFFTSAAKEGHLLFDLPGYCAWRLSLVGVKSVSVLDVDTYSNEKEFYSYRRMTHRGETEYGRQISVISISS